MKKKILHVIGPLGIGGAELLLLNTINSLEEFDNYLVYLNYSEFEVIDLKNTRIIKLDFNKKHELPFVVLKLRRLIKHYNIDIVHSHLFWPSTIARLACPKNIRLIFSVHSILSVDAFKTNLFSRFLEKASYRPWHEAIFVSEIARKDYKKFVGLKGKSYVLHNFISDEFYQDHKTFRDFSNSSIKLVAVGKLKEAKNYPYLLRAFKILKDKNITLDIYGGGNLGPELQEIIDADNLQNVRLMGPEPDISKLITKYDIFVLSSKHEGFGLAVIEAMACGLPCFISDIPVFREVTAGNAIFFDLKSEQDLINKLLWAIDHPAALRELAEKGYKQAQKFNRENYIQELTAIYNAS